MSTGFWEAIGADVKEAVDGHVVDAVVSAGERLEEAIDQVQKAYHPKPLDSFTIHSGELPKELTTQFVRVQAPVSSAVEGWLSVAVYDEKPPDSLFKDWELAPGAVSTVYASNYELHVENLTTQVLWLSASGAS